MGRKKAEKFVGRAFRKPAKGDGAFGERLVSRGGRIDQLVKLNAEVAILPDEGSGRVIGTVEVLRRGSGGREKRGEEGHAIKKSEESGRD